MAEEINVSQTSIQLWVKQYKEFGQEFFIDKVTQNKPMSLVDADELVRLQAIEVAYEEQQIQVEILKKFQTFLKQK